MQQSSERSSKRAYFGDYGGQFVPETLIEPLRELETAFQAACEDASFWKTWEATLKDYVGRPTPLYHAERLSKTLGGAQIYLKREDLNHTGSHKINNTLGQVLLAQRMKKQRIIAETGAGMHGVATATVAARFGLRCEVYMGARDVERQAPNVGRMHLLGAQVHAVKNGSATLKDAMNEALRDWVARVDDTFYVIGSVAGPHPYPAMVRRFQQIIGREARQQFESREGRLPALVIACVGGGSNAIGIFSAFLDQSKVALCGVEAAGRGLDTQQHAATLSRGRVGILHGSKSYLLQNDWGQVQEAHSISAGLDYPGVGPEHSALKDSGRVTYVSATDDEALEAAYRLAREEGILPALESAHAVAEAIRLAPRMGKSETILVCLSGRGDKDLSTLIESAPPPLSS